MVRTRKIKREYARRITGCSGCGLRGGRCSLNRLKSWPEPRIKTRHSVPVHLLIILYVYARIESWWSGGGLLLGIRGIKRILGVVSIFLFGYPAPYLNTIFRQRIYNPCNPLSEVFLRLPGTRVLILRAIVSYLN